MHGLVDKYALALGRTACRWFRGWADARMSAPADACRRIRDAYEENVRLGIVVGSSEILGYAAEASLLAGDVDGAQRQLDEALHIAAKLGERVYLPQLYVVEAAIGRMRGKPPVAEASVRRAIAEARAQEAVWLELMALIDLCEHGGATAEDRRSLAALVDRLPEARDTTAVRKARVLLDRGKSGRPKKS
jgi:hypothetical protein